MPRLQTWSSADSGCCEGASAVRPYCPCQVYLAAWHGACKMRDKSKDPKQPCRRLRYKSPLQNNFVPAAGIGVGGDIGDPLVSSAVSASLLVKYILCDKLTCFHILSMGNAALTECVCVCVYLCVMLLCTRHTHESRTETLARMQMHRPGPAPSLRSIRGRASKAQV